MISDICHNVRAIVSEVERTHTIVSDIHRNVVKGQEGSDGTNPSVSQTRILFITE